MFSTMESDVQLTSSAGTPAFMAPECLDCECTYRSICIVNLVSVETGKILVFSNYPILVYTNNTSV